MSREHGRRLFPPLQVVPWSPEAARARGGGCCVENETDARSSVAPRTRAGDYVHSATTMRMDRGRLRGSMDSSLHLEEATQARCRLAADAGRRGPGGPGEGGGPAEASDNQHERRELARVPLWPVAAVVGLGLRGIEIAIASVNRACKRRTSSLAGLVAGMPYPASFSFGECARSGWQRNALG